MKFYCKADPWPLIGGMEDPEDECELCGTDSVQEED